MSGLRRRVAVDTWMKSGWYDRDRLGSNDGTMLFLSGCTRCSWYKNGLFNILYTFEIQLHLEYFV